VLDDNLRAGDVDGVTVTELDVGGLPGVGDCVGGFAQTFKGEGGHGLAETCGGLAEKFSQQERMNLAQGFAGEDECAATPGGAGGANGGRGSFDQGLGIGGDGGKLIEPIGHAGADGLEQRQHFVTNAVAGETRRGVGLVFTPGLVQVVEIGVEFRAGERQQRTHQRDLAAIDGERLAILHGGETVKTAATDHVQQNRLGLVVGMMGEQHSVAAVLAGELGQGVETGAASGIFAGSGAEAERDDIARQRELLGQTSDKTRISR